MTTEFTNKVAVVTGGGKGMGKTIAEALARDGARVVIGARTLSHGEETLAEFKAKGYDVGLCQCDVTIREDCAGLINYAVEEFGGVDILVHCAADIPMGLVEDLPEESFKSCLDSILSAAFWLTKDAAPHLGKSGSGRVIYISSTAAKSALPGLSHYSAAKAGLDAFARGMAMELGRKNVTVNTINPGLIASDRMQSHLTPEHQKALSANLPVPRPGTTEEIANMVVFMASDKAAYMTGANVVIDGGATLGDVQAAAMILSDV